MLTNTGATLINTVSGSRGGEGSSESSSHTDLR